MAVALLLCLAGAAVALFGASRTWAVELTARPAPLPVLRTTRTGGDLLPWLPALALVGLAGAGAVLATRGVARRLLGGLLLLVGLGIAAGGAYAAVAVDRGMAGPAGPLLCVAGGLTVAVGGALTALGGHRWPGLGARYESPNRAGAPAPGMGDGRMSGRVYGRATSEAWDALDRGEDPTAG
ncbi:MAG TPA: Trp biosynthesis-associated membrane protein [Micromonosporaceae bacterium]